MVAASVYLILGRNLIRFIFGLVLAGNAINLLIFTVGGLENRRPPIIPNYTMAVQEPFANALPQALILTAIVIGFALLSFIFVLFYRAYQDLGTVDTEFMRAAESDTNPQLPVSRPKSEGPA
jgi:multicomponent Na+:H+ antiporter subunit C